MHALAEACRNVSVVGAKPLAYTDGLNLGSPETPEGYHELAETIAGLKEASEALGVPVVSGNVSLYNESGGKRIPHGHGGGGGGPGGGQAGGDGL